MSSYKELRSETNFFILHIAVSIDYIKKISFQSDTILIVLVLRLGSTRVRFYSGVCSLYIVGKWLVLYISIFWVMYSILYGYLPPWECSLLRV